MAACSLTPEPAVIGWHRINKLTRPCAWLGVTPDWDTLPVGIPRAIERLRVERDRRLARRSKRPSFEGRAKGAAASG